MSDRLKDYAVFEVVGADQLLQKTTVEGWDLVQVLDEMQLQDVTGEEVNPHPPPSGYSWPAQQYGYNSSSSGGWHPTIQVRSWQPHKVARFLLGKAKDKYLESVTTLQGQITTLGMRHTELEREKNRTVEELKKENSKLQKELDSIKTNCFQAENELRTLKTSDSRKEKELNVKEQTIIDQEKELIELRKLVPVPSAGELGRMVEILPPEIGDPYGSRPNDLGLRKDPEDEEIPF